jgi:XapX domain-containing protein
MKIWILSLALGLIAGGIYATLGIHSPAPPVIALLGLFGMLVGEQLIPITRRLISREPLTLAWFRHECVPKISGTPPSGKASVSPDIPPRSR